MPKKALSWLYGQLPQLVAKGVLTNESADRLREYYGPVDPDLHRWTLLTIFSLIGAILLGLGIMLIIGHNWDHFNHLTRLLVALALLMAAQALAGYALWRKQASTAWREGTALFLTLALGASLALIGQTYHLTDDFSGFMLVWLLLSLPLVYLLEAKGVAVLYFIGILIWLTSVLQLGTLKQQVWLLLALILPYLGMLFINHRHTDSSTILSWFFLFTFYSCVGMTWSFQLGELFYSALFTSTYFSGLYWFSIPEKGWQKPFQVVGLVGNGVLAYLLSFPYPWLHSHWPVSQSEYWTIVAFLMFAGGLLVLLWKQKFTLPSFLGALPLAVIAGYLLQASDKSGLYAAIFMNAFLLAVGVTTLIKGVRSDRLGLLNTGMLLLAALILLRFFDTNFSFVIRGSAFILIGLIFLAVNIFISRRKGGLRP